MNIPRRKLEMLSIPRFILEDEPACAQADPELFFPQEMDMGFGKFSSSYYNLEAAKRVCDGCPLKLKCLEYALHNPQVGIWGGTTESQRENLKRSIRRKKAKSLLSENSGRL